MTVKQVTDPSTPIGDVLRDAGGEGVLLESPDAGRYALMPLDADMVDYLLERSPKFRAECERIREQMRAGQFQTHEQVKKLLEAE